MPRHAETKVLPYTAQQMYDLVADVESYPNFLPWNTAARIRSRQQQPDGSEVIEADLVISFKVFRERFGSRVTLFPDEKRIDTRYLDGPFTHLHSEWDFADRPQGGCEVKFFVDFEFRNALLGKVIGVVFGEAMHRIVRAFEERAKKLYGAGRAADSHRA
ncbi:type II toxin-antitoxin system RatA family toxin [Paracoccus sp. (in: a-proteobacteria)]|uniref:type II toxin-antitoxin system RatA family toxin n=1 Tax=Paracoccus sp. TaxID=267 RepID=UPI0026DF4714|nr:type II toxin-antitoxin system RatA family toxin [Paracoccus sp. (in: a-proteobacteria)]MDO5369074.1 type II toxin-antitoxin system RatA family toxin [Paracoccus sp. (in: a-proteobacteria)]